MKSTGSATAWIIAAGHAAGRRSDGAIWIVMPASRARSASQALLSVRTGPPPSRPSAPRGSGSFAGCARVTAMMRSGFRWRASRAAPRSPNAPWVVHARVRVPARLGASSCAWSRARSALAEARAWPATAASRPPDKAVPRSRSVTVSSSCTSRAFTSPADWAPTSTHMSSSVLAGTGAFRPRSKCAERLPTTPGTILPVLVRIVTGWP